jgi:hypothetical protein
MNKNNVFSSYFRPGNHYPPFLVFTYLWISDTLEYSLKKKSKILQILQLAIYHLICNMYDWKYFVILL